MSVGYWIFLLGCGVAGCLALEIQADGKSSAESNKPVDSLAATKGHLPVVTVVADSSTSIVDTLLNYLPILTLPQQTPIDTSSIWSWLTYVNKNMPLIQIYGSKPDNNTVDKPLDKPFISTGNIFKDFYKNIYLKVVKGYVALYGPNAINRIDPGDKKEEDEDVLCVDEGENKEQNVPTTIQVDVLGQMFKYMTKYIVKRSYTPFVFVKDLFKYFGFINPIENRVQKEPLNVNVIDVDPLTTLFRNIQKFFNTYEKVEKREEETKLINTLARTYVEINKPGLTKEKTFGYTKPCVLKRPQDLWEEIMPYDSSLIFSNLLLVAIWLVAFWAPIFPVLLSFPSRNGFGALDIFDGDIDDGDNRRDQQHFYYDPYESQYIHGGHGNGIHADSQAPHAIKTQIGYHYHNSPASSDDSSHSVYADYVNQEGAQTQAAAGTQKIVEHIDNNIDKQKVSSYTHYNVNDIWHNYANLR